MASIRNNTSVYSGVLAVMFHLLLTAEAFSQTFINPSLEDWGDTALCEINIPPDNWFNFSNAGAGPDEANYPLCPSSIPGRASQGHVYARFMAGNPVSGEGMHQVVLGFAVGRIYHLSFDYAGSNRWGGSDSCHFMLFLNGVSMDSTPVFSSRDTAWRRFDYYFAAPTTAIDFGVRALVPHYGGVGGSAAIDNFSFQESVAAVKESELLPGISIYPNPVKDRLFLQAPAGLRFQLDMVDISGRSLIRQEVWSAHSVDLSELIPGYYTVILSLEDGSRKSIRIIRY
jgi:hypothetical protein